jgi:hypothetical protein
MFSIESKGSFDNLEKFLQRMMKKEEFATLERYGQMGVNALSAATPKDTGMTAASWSYEVLRDSTSYSIIWSNNHVVAGRPVAILLQYGHGTGTGGYIEGRDFINPALRSIFDQIADEVWKVVTAP